MNAPKPSPDGQPFLDRMREDLEATVERYRSTVGLTYAEAVGVLEIVKLDLVEELRDELRAEQAEEREKDDYNADKGADGE